MSDQVQITLITQISTALVAMVTLWKAHQIKKAVEVIRIDVNSKMEAYLKLTAAAAHAEGVQEERITSKVVRAARAEGVKEGRDNASPPSPP